MARTECCALHAAWPRFLTGRVTALFAANGWGADDWYTADARADLLDGPVTWPAVVIGPRHTYNLREWLRHPPEVMATPITPAVMQEALAEYGHLAPNVLNAYAAGATERFVAAFVNNRQTWFRHNFLDNKPDMVWDSALSFGFSEPEAVGWALTGGLVDVPTLAGELGDDRDARLIAPWVHAFGNTAYLYVLAGITLSEAAALRAADRSPEAPQLRVMVALNGVVLPAGV